MSKLSQSVVIFTIIFIFMIFLGIILFFVSSSIDKSNENYFVEIPRKPIISVSVNDRSSDLNQPNPRVNFKVNSNEDKEQTNESVIDFFKKIFTIDPPLNLKKEEKSIFTFMNAVKAILGANILVGLAYLGYTFYNQNTMTPNTMTPNTMTLNTTENSSLNFQETNVLNSEISQPADLMNNVHANGSVIVDSCNNNFFENIKPESVDLIPDIQQNEAVENLAEEIV